jgi:1-acyl-sn-glycerol-3-phosphate acyltransferase
MVLAHSPNGGDGEPEVTMGATDAGAARLRLMARDVPPTRDPRGCLLPAAERPLQRDRVARVVIRLLLALFFRVQVEGRERIPTGRPLICAANHHSWLDPFLLLAILPLAPRRYALGINAGAAVSPVWRRIIGPFHTLIPLDRARPQAAIHAMEDILERGNTLIIFPEGGIGPGDGRVRPLQSGTAYLAQRTGYPILTVGITGSYDLWWRKRLTVRIGPCIDPAHFVEGTARARRTALLADLRAQIQALLVRERAHHGPTLLRKTLTNLF